MTEKDTQINPDMNEPIPEVWQAWMGKELIDKLVRIDDGPYLQKLANTIGKQVREGVPPTQIIRNTPGMLLDDSVHAINKPDKFQPGMEVSHARGQSNLSDVVESGYGMCTHFHALALLTAEYLNKGYLLLGNKDKHHTFGFVFDEGDEDWKLADSHAPHYYKYRLFRFPQSIYYDVRHLKKFAESTSVTAEMKKILIRRGK